MDRPHDITLHHRLWEGGDPVRLRLPDRWSVEIVRMAGDSLRALDEADYERAVSALVPLVKGKREVCVLFDDISRPTKASAVVPSLLRLFERCAIRDEQVRFLCSLGSHAPLDNTAFRKKLGAEVLERFPVYNHNCFGTADDLGRTSLGTPILVNSEYRSCDLKIGIGAFVPHSFCGYGGGYKAVMPGVAHVDAIVHHHSMVGRRTGKFNDLGQTAENELLDDVKEFGRTAGLDIKIDLLVNSAADGTAIFAGPPDDLYAALGARAPAHYTAPVSGKADIVFTNVHAKGNEAAIALWQAELLLKEEGGDIVVLCDTEAGQVVHYVLGRFGNTTWGRLSSAARPKGPKVRRIFLVSRYKDLANSCSFGDRDEIDWRADPGELVRMLEDEYRDRSVDAFVVPDGTIQMFSFV